MVNDDESPGPAEAVADDGGALGAGHDAVGGVTDVADRGPAGPWSRCGGRRRRRAASGCRGWWCCPGCRRWGCRRRRRSSTPGGWRRRSSRWWRAGVDDHGGAVAVLAGEHRVEGAAGGVGPEAVGQGLARHPGAGQAAGAVVGEVGVGRRGRRCRRCSRRPPARLGAGDRVGGDGRAAAAGPGQRRVRAGDVAGHGQGGAVAVGGAVELAIAVGGGRPPPRPWRRRRDRPGTRPRGGRRRRRSKSRRPAGPR